MTIHFLSAIHAWSVKALFPVSTTILLCGSALTAHAATLTIANGAEPGTLDPQKKSGNWESNIDRELFATLIATDEKGNLIPGLAEKWESSPDGKTYTFHLREAKWSDGQPITAEDAVYALRRELTPQTAAYNASIYYPILNAPEISAGKAKPDSLGVKALDARTLQIQLSQPMPYLLQTLAQSDAAPLPAHYIEHAKENWIKAGQTVVSGPFQLASWRPQSVVRLDKNPNFYDADKVKLDTVNFLPIDDAQSALNRFRTGEVNISYSGVPASQYHWVKANIASELKVAPFIAEYFYVFNQRHGSILDDKRIREALNLVTRREVITNTLLKQGQRPSYWFLPRDFTGGAKGEMAFASMQMKQRLQRAKELMHEAGYSSDHPLHLEIAYNTSEDHRRIAVAVGAMWKQIGVEVTFTNREAAVHFNTLRDGHFQVGRYGSVATVDDPQDFLSSFTTGNAANYSHYSNPHYDELVAASNMEMDPVKRARLLTEAQQILLDDYALLPLYDYVSLNLVSDKVHGWSTNPMDIHPLRYVSVSE